MSCLWSKKSDTLNFRNPSCYIPTMRWRIIIFLWAWFGIAQSVLAQYPVSLPVHHPLYSFLDRLETLGVISNARNDVRPLSRGIIARLLQEAREHQDRLSPVDRQLLQQYLADYRRELHPEKPYPLLFPGKHYYSPLLRFSQLKADWHRLLGRPFPEEENHLFVWEDSSAAFFLDFRLQMGYDRRLDGVWRSGFHPGYYARGYVGTRFGYAAFATQYTVQGDKTYRLQTPELRAAFPQDFNTVVFFDRTGGEVALTIGGSELRLAQQFVQWGNGESGQMVLSDNAEQFPYFNWVWRWQWGAFYALQGKLLPEAQDSVGRRPVLPDKWIAVHRLEVYPWQWLTLAFTESFIYGNRYLEWSYLLPFNLYFSVEHTLQDRDNKTMALDVEIRRWPGVKWYATLFLDELAFQKLFTSWYGNKHAILSGIVLEDPLGLANTRLRVEYVAIMPWVYTHRFAINRYTHYYRPLGYWAGPNSEVWYVHAQRQWTWRLLTGIKFQQWRHGENYPNENIGGNILLGHDDLLGSQTEPRTTRKFLEGILSTTRMTELYIQYQVLNQWYLVGGTRWQWRHRVGETTVERTFYARLSIDF